MNRNEIKAAAIALAVIVMLAVLAVSYDFLWQFYLDHWRVLCPDRSIGIRI